MAPPRDVSTVMAAPSTRPRTTGLVMKRSVRILESAEDVSRAAATTLVECAREAIRERGRFVVVLAGGDTPRRLYELLAREPFRNQVAWSEVEFFWGDERAVPPDHPRSNFRMANDALLSPLGIAPLRTHRIEAESPDRDAAAWAYQAEIARVLAVPAAGEPPVLDLVLLGMGPDGHTASLFPHTPALREEARWVVANHVPALDAERVTLTPVIINRAACVLFLVAGTDKAGALAKVLEGPSDPDGLPAQRIAPREGRHIWLTDRAAARLLRAVAG